MTNALKALIREHVTDPTVSGLVIETEFEPLAGRSGAVAPPTYAGDGDDPVHAYTEEAFIPDRSEEGWYTGLQKDPESGAPRLAPRVVLNSFAAESGRAETALWQQQERIRCELPGIILKGRSAQQEEEDEKEEDSPALTEALDFAVSTWELAHRQNDGWLRYATADGTRQVWQDDADGDEPSVKRIITSASAERGSLLYSYFPNSAVWGFWLSSGVAARHRLPRAYSSEIIGYNARPVLSGATKLDPTGGTPNSIGVAIDKHGALALTPKVTRQTKPSARGFGFVPGSPVARTYTCELILQQSTLSLPVLRSIRFETAEQSAAALTVLVLLAATGHALAGEDGFLRSTCALNTVERRWGWKRQGTRAPEAFDAPSVDDLSAALREAIDDAEAVGLRFAPVITLMLSDVERELIAKRVEEAPSLTESGDD
ncbi:type I-U CRISPR-associated protein Cas7 [Gulosibacter sp. 10]|uniref:type I-G CRISPR-associated protein Cas7 n=1 Tax=Gulosibacter sp. 10 TaxID=1255570 RepID=UPI00097F0C1D|nr:type I-U CRISPR-associated protein Cas7 [Gulosibacter sp. 10]SJM62726.1 hypothetical protein FM112_08720 [Gulosibacter sp. 10]